MPGPTEVQQARRDNGPMTGRGVARRQALLRAARAVFERKGFTETRVADIVQEAAVAHGTFYTYFDTKEAVFTEVARAVVDEMLADMATSIPTSGLETRVHDAVERFVRAYRPHAAMIAQIEQVALHSDELRSLRLEIRDTFVRRTRRGIERMRADGLTPEDLDVEYTAESLGAMLEYVSYLWFTLGKEFDEERLVDALAAIWLAALRRTG